MRWRRQLSGSGSLTDDAFYESAYTRRQLIELVSDAGFSVEVAAATSHSFTLWGLGRLFREPGYYQTNDLAETLGELLKLFLPWAFNYSTLIIARK